MKPVTKPLRHHRRPVVLAADSLKSVAGGDATWTSPPPPEPRPTDVSWQ